MIKKLLIILLLLAPGLNAQRYMNFEYMKYYDSSIIAFLKSINNDMGAEKILVYQAVMTEPENRRDLVTFVISSFSDKVSVRMITSCFIYSIVELKDSKIFDYKYINDAGVAVNENKLKNAPNILDPYKGSEIVMLYTPSQKFFYEVGKPANFVEDKNKIKYRKDWLEIIKQEIKGNLEKFERETIYTRETALSYN